MFNLRKKIFIITGIVVALILAGLLWYMFVYKKANLGTEDLTKETGNNQEITNQDNNQPASTLTIKPAADPDGLYAKQKARDFVERFSSYSNQDGGKHLTDVMDLVTPAMATWLKKQVVPQSNTYLGYSTQVIAMDLISRDEQKAVVQVSAQVLQQSATSSEYLQKTGRVELLKIDNDWKIDGLYWNKN